MSFLFNLPLYFLGKHNPSMHTSQSFFSFNNHLQSNILSIDEKVQASACFFPICMHAEKAAVLSEALQACILWILVVQFMFTDRICVVTPSYWGWDGVVLVQYCVCPEVEIILFAVIAVKHLISHQTFFHTNIPAMGFERWEQNLASKLHRHQKFKKMQQTCWCFNSDCNSYLKTNNWNFDNHLNDVLQALLLMNYLHSGCVQRKNYTFIFIP